MILSSENLLCFPHLECLKTDIDFTLNTERNGLPLGEAENLSICFFVAAPKSAHKIDLFCLADPPRKGPFFSY